MLKNLPRPFFILAPMDDVTDTVFRQIVGSTATPDLFFTEFVNVDGLQSPGRKKLLHKLALSNNEGPVIAQIWGRNPDNYYKTVKEIVDGSLAAEANELVGLNKAHSSNRINSAELQGGKQYDTINFSGVDINMGCPDKAVVKNGCCSALINDRQHAAKIIEAVQEAAGPSFPTSVKTRVGFTTVDLSWIEFLLSKKLNMLSIHARTVKEMSKVPAHWELFADIKKLRDDISPATLLVGNGDIMNHAQGEEVAKKYGLDGIMIGRGIFHDPYAFAQESPWPNVVKQERIRLYKKHVQLFAHTWQNDERKVHTLNKFCKVYIQGFDGAKELREKVMMAKSTDDALSILDAFL